MVGRPRPDIIEDGYTAIASARGQPYSGRGQRGSMAKRCGQRLRPIAEVVYHRIPRPISLRHRRRRVLLAYTRFIYVLAH